MSELSLSEEKSQTEPSQKTQNQRRQRRAWIGVKVSKGVKWLQMKEIERTMAATYTEST